MIKVEDIYKTYSVGSVDVQALRGVSFDLQQSEMCCIIGKSGSGKSTLLNAIAGIESVTKGRVIVAGHHLEAMSQSELVLFRQKHIGFVFQSFNLFPQYTALENVALPLMFQGVPQEKRNKKACDLLEEMGILRLKNHKPSQMSGGEQQRVAIARALITNPEIILADEPTGNLDSANTNEVMKVLSNQVKKSACTLVMVTHDIGLTEYANRIITLCDGKVIETK